MSISLCMIVKNEERCIMRCLESIGSHVDEIIIVDTGSTDNTLNIIRNLSNYASYGDKIKLIHHEWNDDFSEARNISLDHATSKYILQLDADEMINREDLGVFQNAKDYLYHSDEFCTVDLILQNHDNCDSVYSKMLRIFPNLPELRFTRKVHEILNLNQFPHFKRTAANVHILHDGYDSTIIDQVGKKQRNLKLLNDMIQDNPNDYASLYYFSRDLFTINPIESIGLLAKASKQIPNDSFYKKETEKELETALKKLKLTCPKCGMKDIDSFYDREIKGFCPECDHIFSLVI